MIPRAFLIELYTRLLPHLLKLNPAAAGTWSVPVAAKLRSLNSSSHQKMQAFARNRDTSPSIQNARSKLDRRAIAARAKVPMGRGRPIVDRQNNGQAVAGLPARGFGNAANISASVTKQEPAVQKTKVDVYDTDAESIDTTLNQSVIQPVHNAEPDLALHGTQDHVSDSMPTSDDSAEDQPWGAADDYEFADDEVAYLDGLGLGNLNRPEAVAYLNANYHAHRGMTLPTVDGDSYPNTTEGDPIEAITVKGESSDEFDENRSASPSPQRRPDGVLKASALQPGPIRTWEEGRNHNMQGQKNIFQKGNHLRSQHRVQSQFDIPHRQTLNHDIVVMPSSQPPTYSQVQAKPSTEPTEKIHVRSRQRDHNVKPGSAVNAYLPAPPVAHISTRKQPTSIIELSSSVTPPSEHPDSGPTIDYVHETLFAMDYSELKNQSFDDNPHAKSSVLTEDLVDKSLPQRLEFVHRNLDVDKQGNFFTSLSTNDWEDAGDWILEQFNTIIRRTKEARQRKRKLAQDFEEEVAKRHKHVAKKQHQVEEAMGRMKAQGEGIIPRTPRSGKSPKGKRT